MKQFKNENLNTIIKTQKKHNLFNWVTPKATFWTKKLSLLLLELIAITFVVFTVVFLLIHQMPGQPKAINDILSSHNSEPSKELAIKAKQAYYHIDGSLFNQYLWSIRAFFDGTMGISWSSAAPVSLTFWGRLGTSMVIGFSSMIFSFAIGIPCGIYLARRETRFSDISASILSVISFSIPSFVFALLSVGINKELDLPFVFEYGNVFMIMLPAIIIAIPMGFGYTRYLRSSIRSEYKEQYVALARIKGVSESKILTKHILKPALFPIVNYLPFLVVGAFFGSITIETVFAIPGAGNMLINAALENDQPVILAITIVYTIFMVLSFFIRDLLITFIDPRIRGE